MQTSFDIVSASGSYAVEVRPGALTDTLRHDGRERVVVIDAFLAENAPVDGAIIITADEHAKSLDRMTELVIALQARRATRGTTLVAIGGGVVQDAAAFAASIYMRGIPWIYVPTTLLSMTDSCIGGKSSINVGPLKNIAGTFHPPERVVVDPDLARSLTAEQRAAGLCEAAKICLCRGAETFSTYLALAPCPTMASGDLAAVIELSLRTKKWFIEIDEFDRNERLLLNFGHTFGHALEAASGFAVSHGIGVGLGMMAAIEMAERMGRAPRQDAAVRAFEQHVTALIGVVPGLTETLRQVDAAKVLDAFEGDKKHKRDQYAVILPIDGRIERVLLPRDAATREWITEGIAAMLRFEVGEAATA